MPYVPLEDRKTILDPVVERLAQHVAPQVSDNKSLRRVYRSTFMKIAGCLNRLLTTGSCPELSFESGPETDLARAIYSAGEKYGYGGAYLGELNYSIFTLIQRVPQVKVQHGEWEPKNEIRYWLYAVTVGALNYAMLKTQDLEEDISSVFMDIKDEYKWRVNRPYETAQIIKNDDCVFAPFNNKLVPVRFLDADGKLLFTGHIYVDFERSEATLNKDVLDFEISARKQSRENVSVNHKVSIRDLEMAERRTLS